MHALSFTSTFPRLSPINLNEYKSKLCASFSFSVHTMIESGLIKLSDRRQEMVIKFFGT